MRTVIAVIVGFLGIGALVRFTDMMFARFAHGFDPKSPPLYYFAVSLATDFVYSIIGGYICALIAEERRQKATLWLVVAGEILGAIVQMVLWTVVPHWYGIGLLILYPLGVWIGSRLGGRRPVAVT